MFYANDLLQHLKAVKLCAEKLGFAFRLNPGNMALDIKKGDLEVRFQPRFLYYDKERGSRNYTYYFQPDVTGFVGWLPYFNKVWPEALDKLAFKALCRDKGLLTPDWWTKPSSEVKDFLVKRKGGSFGAGMRGPFHKLDRDNPYHQLADGEYYERFIEGRIAKIWYWNAEPVCLELRPFPRIAGDGIRTIRELLEAGPLADSLDRVRWPQFETVAAYQGKTLASVLKPKECVFAGFRYGSLLDAADLENRNVLAKVGGPIKDHLRAIGAALYGAITEEVKPGVLFTVDATLDREDKAWLLEMNPNPTVHPDVYASLLGSVLGNEVAAMPSIDGGSPDVQRGGLVWANQPRSAEVKR